MVRCAAIGAGKGYVVPLKPLTPGLERDADVFATATATITGVGAPITVPTALAATTDS